MSLRSSGRLTGALFLLAFVCYGIGSALAGRLVAVALVLLNSGIVAAIGILVLLAIRGLRLGAAWVYLVARSVEAILLTVGVVLRTCGQHGAATIAYQLAMLVLGL